MRTPLRLGAVLLAAMVAATVRAQDRAAVDLELVIAVDVSRSMDRGEFLLQRRGYVAAIRHPDFARAVASGDLGRIALTYVEWSGRLHQKVVVPWRMIDGAGAAEAFAAALESRPLEIGRGTSISTAINFATALLQDNDYRAARQVIDISGDGPNNYGGPITEARDAAVGNGVVINGLPIVIRPSPIVADIVRYYEDCVIGGPGAFVLPVRQASEFAAAIRRKLILEVAGETGRPGIVNVQAAPPVDCLVGEKMRERYSDPFYPGLDN